MKKIVILSLILLSAQVFAWDFIRNKKGNLTGYSTPISQDIFKDLNIDPSNKKQRLKSPNVVTDLFSSPRTNNTYDRSGSLKRTYTDGVGAKAGVTIIYD